MKFKIRSRDRRAFIALSIAIVAYLLFAFAVFPAFDALSGASDRVTEKENELRKYRRAVVRKGHYEKLLVQARKNMTDNEARLIRGDNPSLAAVELQTIVEGAASKLDIALSQR